MGAKHPKMKKFLQKKKKEKKTTEQKQQKQAPKIVEEIFCPNCNKKFLGSQGLLFNDHIKICLLLKIEKVKSCDLYPPSLDYNLNQLIFQNILLYGKNEPNNYIEKIIEDKINEIKTYLKSKTIGGIFYLTLDRDNLLKDTLEKTKSAEFFKKWQIGFSGEDGVDAGGLMRDYFSNIFEILEGEQLKLFIPGESSDFTYILNPFLMQTEENFQYCRLIGLLMAKAVHQNITINICFNKLIYKMILCEKVEFEDLIFIDSQLYNSLQNLKENLQYNMFNDDENNINNNNDLIKELGLDYSIEIKDCFNHIHSLELIENGRNVIVENLEDFIQKRINFFLGIYEPFIKQIRDSFYKYMPIDKVKSLNSNELELLLNGRPFIEIEEWKSFTEYSAPYNANHMVIKWFWEILSELSQKELSNILLFATGSSRVPLGGFAVLESNSGKIYKFRITFIKYENNIKNFIRAHTCFNTIDLPCYTNKNELKEAIKFISENPIWGFGMK